MVSLSKERLVIFDIVKHNIEYSSNTCIKKNDITHLYGRFYCTEEFPFIKRGEGVLKEVFFNELRNCVKFQRYAKEVRNVEFKQINFNLCFILLILNNARCNGVHLI